MRPIIAALAFAALGACQSALPSGVVPNAMSLVAVTPGQTLPFGQLARACEVDRGALGMRIETADGYELYDSAPGTTAPRTHYITGFSDGCPRQVTGGLAMFGDMESHAALMAAGGLPRSRLDDLAAGLGNARRTVFVTVYRGFGGGEFGDVLLSGGEVVAAEF